MQSVSPERLRGIAADIQIELKRLQRLADDIAFVRGEITRDPGHARLFYENLALKLHNFYTGCERIFQTIATGFQRFVAWLEALAEQLSSV